MQKLHRLVLAGALGALVPSVGLGAPQGQSVPKVGSCPLGYFSSGSYCVPNPAGTSREAIQKVGRSCPLGWFTSGNYCVKSR